MPPTWLIIIAVVVFIAGAACLGYGLVKHEDKNEKTTTHKLLIGVGIGLVIFGVAIILWAIISKFTQKPKPQNEQIDMAPKPMLSRPGYNPSASTPVYNPNVMYSPNMNTNMDFNANQMMYNNPMPVNYPTVQNMNPYNQYQY